MIKGARRLGGGQGTDDALVEQPDGIRPEPMAGVAEAVSRRSRLVVAHPAGVLEDHPDGQVGQHAHGEHHPEHDAMGQPAGLLPAESAVRENLVHDLLGDNLLQTLQSIQYKISIIMIRRRRESFPHLMASSGNRCLQQTQLTTRP